MEHRLGLASCGKGIDGRSGELTWLEPGRRMWEVWVPSWKPLRKVAWVVVGWGRSWDVGPRLVPGGNMRSLDTK